MSFFEFPHTRTYDSDLGWLIKDCKTLDEAVKVLDNWVENTQPKLEDMYNLYLQIMGGNLPESVTIGISKWMEEHGLDLLGSMAKMVFFGINDAGYFVAYIPESWDDITFGTSGLDDFPVGIEYGHLTLSY